MRAPSPRRVLLGAALLLACASAAAALGTIQGELRRWLDGDRDRDDLPGHLQEVSGLAVGPEGHLWAHDDERGAVSRLEDGGGAVVERRILGPEPVLGDFEGLAWDGRRFHLVSSTGTLVSFEPGNRERVDRYSIRRTAADGLCEVEGLEYDAAAQRLVMACKTTFPRRWRRHVVLLEAALPGDADDLTRPPLPVEPRVVVTPASLAAAGIDEGLSPSGVTRAPRGGGWLVVAARDRLILHLSDGGRVLDHARLPSRHRQAEGIAATADVLTLADEGGDGRGRITRYTHPTPPPGGFR